MAEAAADHEGELALVVKRLIDAPRRLVFTAWTQPEHIARWWGPQGFTTIACTMDIRPGPQSVSIVGQTLIITRGTSTTRIDTPGTRIAAVSKFKFWEESQGVPLKKGN